MDMDNAGGAERLVRKPGRPKIPADRRRDIMFELRLSESEYRQIREHADRVGMSMSEFLRTRALMP
jgi:hypothetical protein